MGRAEWPTGPLVAAAQGGDPDSLAVLVSGTYPHVRRFAFSLCASDQDAEDAAQEAMIVLFRRIGTLRATAALASWLFRIVRNECLRRARVILRDEVVPPVRSAEDAALDRLEVQHVAAAIAALPDDQRRVLVMRDVQGLPGSVVARSLGLTTATMKSRLHRARAAVRTELSR